jgi:hypothetical protein
MISLNDIAKAVKNVNSISKIEEIFRAWGIALNPNDEQYELAKKRLEICETCEFKSDNPVRHCTVCGCALKGKVYSPVKGACPKGKWNKIDSESTVV